MNTSLPLLFLLSVLAACAGQKEIIVEKFPNGNTKIAHVLHTNATNDSIIKEIAYRENGKKSATGFLIGGKLHGTWMQWYMDVDQKESEINFNRHNKEGLSTYWYKNGQKKQEINYSRNFENGMETQWYENGNKKSEGAWADGKNIGQWTYWFENGQMKEQGSYKGGEFEKLSLYSSKSRPGFIPQKDGEWIYWNKSGYIVKAELWEQGQLKTK
jgi:antitoxin component YwqK of YwqJK toxin-antitoxin module